MGQKMKVEFLDEAVDALTEMGRITGNRRPDEVVSDALKTYQWILHQQTFGSNIVSTTKDLSTIKDQSTPKDHHQPLAKLVEDEKAAKAYFDRMGW
jgi:hypothetical protein